MSYQGDIVSARDRVAWWFATNGIAIDPAEIVNTAVVFADVLEAKRHMSKHFGEAIYYTAGSVGFKDHQSFGPTEPFDPPGFMATP